MVQCGMLYSAVQNGVVWYVWYGMGVVGLMLCGKKSIMESCDPAL